LSFAVNVDAMPLVVIEAHFGRTDLNVQLAAAQVDVQRDGSFAQSQRQIIFSIA
jgi:hypothetical protein